MRNYVSDYSVSTDVCLGIFCLGEIFLYLIELNRGLPTHDLLHLKVKRVCVQGRNVTVKN